MNTLIMTVGLPRSGKSTWAKTWEATAVPIVSPDAVRLALTGQRFVATAEPMVWGVAKTMVRALFLAGHQIIILDATNTTRARRDEWKDRDWLCQFKVFDTPVELCKARAIATDRADLLPVIEKMAAAFEPLGPDEVLW